MPIENTLDILYWLGQISNQINHLDRTESSRAIIRRKAFSSQTQNIAKGIGIRRCTESNLSNIQENISLSINPLWIQSR